MMVVAAAVYTATMALGISAVVSRRSFGRWHHVFYFVSCATAALAVLLEPSWFLVPVLVLLALMPMTKAGSRMHALVGSVGWLCWVVALWWMSHSV
jgi:hypothetical protein